MIELERTDAFPAELESNAPYSCAAAWLDLCSGIYGYRLFRFLVKSGPRVIGGFCCAAVPSAIFGTRLVSMPFSDEPGLWFLPGEDPEAEDIPSLWSALSKTLDTLAKGESAVYAELRGMRAGGEGFLSEEPYLRLALDTTRPYEELRNNFHVNLIKNLRKADRTVLFAEEKGPGSFRRVHGIYLRQMKRFGSPPLPAEHFEALLSGGCGRLFTASVGGRTAALLFAIIRNGTFYADVNAGLAGFEAFFPKIKLFDETIRLACREGLRSYDFMRTRRGSGVHAHKAKWGGKESVIPYCFRRYRNGARTGLDPEESRFTLPRLLIKSSPLALLRAFGPAIRRHAGK